MSSEGSLQSPSYRASPIGATLSDRRQQRILHVYVRLRMCTSAFAFTDRVAQLVMGLGVGVLPLELRRDRAFCCLDFRPPRISFTLSPPAPSSRQLERLCAGPLHSSRSIQKHSQDEGEHLRALPQRAGCQQRQPVCLQTLYTPPQVHYGPS